MTKSTSSNRYEMLVALGLLAISSSGGAQVYDPGFSMTPIEYNLPYYAGEVVKNQDSAKPNHISAPQREELSFHGSHDNRATNIANFARKMRQSGDAQGAAALEALTANTDVIAQIDDAMQSQLGLSASNVADAYAVWWVSAWKAANGQSDTASRGTYQAVKNQAANGLIASPEFARATDAQKQEMAEALLIQSALIDASMEQAAGNAQQLRALGDAVRKGAKASGLDLDTMVLTEQGFRPSGRHSNAVIPASDPTAPVADQASAAAPAATANDNIAVPKSVLYGGLAVLGLGGAYWFGKSTSKKG